MELNFKGGRITYFTTGEGPVLVFLHGFLESARIWSDFSRRLSKHYRIVRINLPGHGGSSVFSESHPMDLMAEAVHAVLVHEKIDTFLLIGHSMGGYVSVAFAERWPEMIRGLIMFSTWAFADTPQRKEERDRALVVSESHKYNYIRSVVPNQVYLHDGYKAQQRIKKLVNLANAQRTAGISAALRGMRDRPDRSEILYRSEFPVLFIAGSHDPLITPDKIEEMKNNIPGSAVYYLGNSGHFGFIEQSRESLKAIRKFARRIFQK